MNSLCIEEINTVERFHALAAVWNDLLCRNDMDNPFLTFEWFSTWWKVFGGDKELFILVVRDGSEVIAIAPLMKARMIWRRIPVKTIALMANDHSGRSGFIIGRDDAGIGEHIFDYIRQQKSRYDMVRFDYIPRSSLTYDTLQNALRKRHHAHIELKSSPSPYISINGTWEEYIKNRSKNLKSKLRLLANQMTRRGKFEIVHYSRTADVLQAMAEVLAISRSTWKFREGTAIASDPSTATFYSALAGVAAEKGWLAIRVLKFNGAPVAFTYNLDYKGVSYYLKTGFDEAYRSHSIGGFLVYAAIKECFEQRFLEYDFLGSDESYKLQLTSQCREHCKCIVFGDNAYARALHLFESVVVAGTKRVLGKME